MKGEGMSKDNLGQSPSQSPTDQSNAKATLSFYEALKELSIGHRITKLEWGNEAIYLELIDGTLQIHMDDNKYHYWVISEGDMLGMDYIIA